ncbi:MAG: hypothetical protein QXH39_05320 [Conexivisphaerales archaeon]
MNEGKRGKPYAYSDALMLIILAVKDTSIQADRDAWWSMGSQDTILYPDLQEAEGAKGST